MEGKNPEVRKTGKSKATVQRFYIIKALVVERHFRSETLIRKVCFCQLSPPSFTHPAIPLLGHCGHSSFSICLLNFATAIFGGKHLLQAFKCIIETTVSLRVFFNKSYPEEEVNTVRTLPSYTALG